VTITSVEGHDSEIRVNFDTVSPPILGSRVPRGGARDNLGNKYDDGGASIGLLQQRANSIAVADRAESVARGMLTVPLPISTATARFIRITWDSSGDSIWESPAHEVCVLLAD
jgi:hypothetical protein